MINRMFSSQKAVANPTKVRDVLLDFFRNISSQIKEKKDIDSIIQSISKKDISINDCVKAYKDFLHIVEKSLYDDKYRINGRQIPSNPIDNKLMQRIKELID